MPTRIIINGKEVTNPVIKAALVVGATITSAVTITVVAIVLLPIIGIAVTLSVGFITVFIVASILGVAALIVSATIFGWLFGSMEYRVEKTIKRK